MVIDAIPAGRADSARSAARLDGGRGAPGPPGACEERPWPTPEGHDREPAL